MLKALTDMSYFQASDADIEEDCCLFLNRNITTVLEAMRAKLRNKGKKDMKTHAKFIANAVRMAVDQFLNPGMTFESRGVIRLLPVEWISIESNSKPHCSHHMGTECEEQHL